MFWSCQVLKYRMPTDESAAEQQQVICIVFSWGGGGQIKSWRGVSPNNNNMVSYKVVHTDLD